MKNYLKIGILLFGISVLLENCETEFEGINSETEKLEARNLKTVPLANAKNFFIKNYKEKEESFSKGTIPLELTPNWETLNHKNLYQIEEAQLTLADVKVNRSGNYSSSLFFINVNDQIRNVIYTVYKKDTTENGDIINGRIYFNKINGVFIDGYRIEEGKFTERFVVRKKETVQKASFLPFFSFFQGNDQDAECWNTETLEEFEGGVLGEVIVTATGGGGSGYQGSDNTYSIIRTWNNNAGDGGGHSISGGGGGGTTSVAGSVFVTTTESNEDGEEVEEEEQCKNEGKVYNKATKKCECPKGKTEDKDGKCVDKPCENNPVKSPDIAPQKGASGKKGAFYGCTRVDADETCGGVKGKKQHAGIDLKSDYGDPIYAMYDGFIFSTKYQKDKAGYNTRIQSTINGKTILVSYFHLQKENRVLQGNPLVQVKTGDIIGYQGDSGNLKGAIADKRVDSHVHIEVREHDGSTKWGYANFNLVDPRTYFSTTIKDDGTSEVNTNCN